MTTHVNIYDTDDFSEDSFSDEEEIVHDGGAKAHPPSPRKSAHHVEPFTILKAPENEYIPEKPCHQEKEEEERSSSSEISSEDDESEDSDIIDAFSKDPLFLIMGQYLSNDKGNIVDALFQINKSLKTIIHLMKK